MLSGDQIFTCPHCNGMVVVPKGQFRHAIYKVTINNIIVENKQVDPHATKEHCDYLIENDCVYGCCKPVQIIGVKQDFGGTSQNQII